MSRGREEGMAFLQLNTGKRKRRPNMRETTEQLKDNQDKMLKSAHIRMDNSVKQEACNLAQDRNMSYKVDGYSKISGCYLPLEQKLLAIRKQLELFFHAFQGICIFSKKGKQCGALV